MANKLTPNDVKKIEEEIRYRTLELRPKLIEAVKEARAQGATTTFPRTYT